MGSNGGYAGRDPRGALAAPARGELPSTANAADTATQPFDRSASNPCSVPDATLRARRSSGAGIKANPSDIPVQPVTTRTLTPASNGDDAAGTSSRIQEAQQEKMQTKQIHELPRWEDHEHAAQLHDQLASIEAQNLFLQAVLEQLLERERTGHASEMKRREKLEMQLRHACEREKRAQLLLAEAIEKEAWATGRLRSYEVKWKAERKKFREELLKLRTPPEWLAKQNREGANYVRTRGADIARVS